MVRRLQGKVAFITQDNRSGAAGRAHDFTIGGDPDRDSIDLAVLDTATARYADVARIRPTD
jgi:hypothetical protein